MMTYGEKRISDIIVQDPHYPDGETEAQEVNFPKIDLYVNLYAGTSLSELLSHGIGSYEPSAFLFQKSLFLL